MALLRLPLLIEERDIWLFNLVRFLLPGYLLLYQFHRMGIGKTASKMQRIEQVSRDITWVKFENHRHPFPLDSTHSESGCFTPCHSHYTIFLANRVYY